jgi:fatty-acyl-CoA synthase
VGIPSIKYGEEAAAYIQLRIGETADPEEFTAFCRDKIAFHKIPAAMGSAGIKYVWRLRITKN